MLKSTEINNFFYSDAFGEMLVRVGNDVEGYRTNNAWLAHHPAQALIFARTEKTWKQLSPTYSGDFRNLIYGELPDPAYVLGSMETIAGRLREVKWNVVP